MHIVAWFQRGQSSQVAGRVAHPPVSRPPPPLLPIGAAHLHLRRSAGSAAQLPASSAAGGIPQDLGHPEKVAFALGGQIQQLLAHGGGLHLVWAADIDHFHSAGGGRHPLGIDGFQLGDVVENPLQLAGVGGDLGLRQIQTGQGGHLAHVVGVDAAHRIAGAGAKLALSWTPPGIPAAV